MRTKVKANKYTERNEISVVGIWGQYRAKQTKNVEMSVEGTILKVKVDLSKEFGPSSSGKTVIIATTEGKVSIPGMEDKKIGLNVYRKK
jgi:hypothetical protein